MHSNPNKVKQLLDLVAEQFGDKADLLYLSSDKHSYTKDNISLYLFGQSKTKAPRDESINFAAPYSAIFCQSLAFADIDLATDHTFRLTTLVAVDAEEVVVTGQWQREGDRLTLTQPQGILAEYDIVYRTFTIDDGLKKSIRLLPIEGQPHVDHCRFDFSMVFR